MSKIIKEKIFFHDINSDKVWGKTYQKFIIEDSETTVWTYDEEKTEIEVGNDGTLHIMDDRAFISLSNLHNLELLKEAIDIAIKKKCEILDDNI